MLSFKCSKEITLSGFQINKTVLWAKSSAVNSQWILLFAKGSKIAKIDHFKAIDAILTMTSCALNRSFSFVRLESLGQPIDNISLHLSQPYEQNFRQNMPLILYVFVSLGYDKED